MKYQHFSEKLMVLDREEEMKKNFAQQNYGGGGQGDYYGGNQGGYDLNEMRQAVGDVPDMSNI